jgi:signal transduction histidine kinase
MTEGQENPRDPLSATDFQHASILIVDDQEADVLLLERTLRGAGYVSVTSTMDPRAVCELHGENRYDLIVIDLMMPAMDGFQVMDALKARGVEAGDYLSVLAVTVEPGHKLRALKAGAKDFISKPLDLDEVLARVHNMLEVRLLQRWAARRRELLETVVEVGTAHSIALDIGRKEAQATVAVLDEQLRQSQKMEAIGQLAGGVAHDFNNLLGVILGYGEMAQRDLAAEHPARARVDQIVKAAERAADLTRQLLAFSRKQVLHPKLLDLNTLVANVEQMVGRLIGANIAVLVQSYASLGAVMADPGQMEQVILNLAVNARDAMPKGGTLILETDNFDVDEGYAAAHPPLQPGRYVMLAVSDTGIGMDAETQLRIFEPFFTTTPEGQGTGLGLSTVHGIVKQSGGHLWVYSEPGRGTSIKVYLPRVDDLTEGPRPDGPPTEAPRGHETILLVEDTETLKEMIRETLEYRGYEVLLAANGEDALLIARERKGPIDLLLTDVVMPSLGGADLARLFLVLRPGTRVLYMSGYTDGALLQHGILGEGLMLLEKPFSGSSVARAVREALDGQERS